MSSTENNPLSNVSSSGSEFSSAVMLKDSDRFLQVESGPKPAEEISINLEDFAPNLLPIPAKQELFSSEELIYAKEFLDSVIEEVTFKIQRIYSMQQKNPNQCYGDNEVIKQQHITNPSDLKKIVHFSSPIISNVFEYSEDMASQDTLPMDPDSEDNSLSLESLANAEIKFNFSRGKSYCNRPYLCSDEQSELSKNVKNLSRVYQNDQHEKFEHRQSPIASFDKEKSHILKEESDNTSPSPPFGSKSDSKENADRKSKFSSRFQSIQKGFNALFMNNNQCENFKKENIATEQTEKIGISVPQKVITSSVLNEFKSKKLVSSSGANSLCTNNVSSANLFGPFVSSVDAVSKKLENEQKICFNLPQDLAKPLQGLDSLSEIRLNHSESSESLEKVYPLIKRPPISIKSKTKEGKYMQIEKEDSQMVNETLQNYHEISNNENENSKTGKKIKQAESKKLQFEMENADMWKGISENVNKNSDIYHGESKIEIKNLDIEKKDFQNKNEVCKLQNDVLESETAKLLESLDKVSNVTDHPMSKELSQLISNESEDVDTNQWYIRAMKRKFNVRDDDIAVPIKCWCDKDESDDNIAVHDTCNSQYRPQFLLFEDQLVPNPEENNHPYLEYLQSEIHENLSLDEDDLKSNAFISDSHAEKINYSPVDVSDSQDSIYAKSLKSRDSIISQDTKKSYLNTDVDDSVEMVIQNQDVTFPFADVTSSEVEPGTATMNSENMNHGTTTINRVTCTNHNNNLVTLPVDRFIGEEVNNILSRDSDRQEHDRMDNECLNETALSKETSVNAGINIKTDIPNCIATNDDHEILQSDIQTSGVITLKPRPVIANEAPAKYRSDATVPSIGNVLQENTRSPGAATINKDEDAEFEQLLKPEKSHSISELSVNSEVRNNRATMPDFAARNSVYFKHIENWFMDQDSEQSLAQRINYTPEDDDFIDSSGGFELENADFVGLFKFWKEKPWAGSKDVDENEKYDAHKNSDALNKYIVEESSNTRKQNDISEEEKHLQKEYTERAEEDAIKVLRSSERHERSAGKVVQGIFDENNILKNINICNDEPLKKKLLLENITNSTDRTATNTHATVNLLGNAIRQKMHETNEEQHTEMIDVHLNKRSEKVLDMDTIEKHNQHPVDMRSQTKEDKQSQAIANKERNVPLEWQSQGVPEKQIQAPQAEQTQTFPVERKRTLPVERSLTATDKQRQDSAVEQNQTLPDKQSQPPPNKQMQSLAVEQSRTPINEQNRALVDKQCQAPPNKQIQSLLAEQSHVLPNEQNQTLPVEQNHALLDRQSQALLSKQRQNIAVEQSRASPNKQMQGLAVEQSRSLPNEQNQTLPVEQSHALLDRQSQVSPDKQRKCLAVEQNQALQEKQIQAVANKLCQAITENKMQTRSNMERQNVGDKQSRALQYTPRHNITDKPMQVETVKYSKSDDEQVVETKLDFLTDTSEADFYQIAASTSESTDKTPNQANVLMQDINPTPQKVKTKEMHSSPKNTTGSSSVFNWSARRKLFSEKPEIDGESIIYEDIRSNESNDQRVVPCADQLPSPRASYSTELPANGTSHRRRLRLGLSRRRNTNRLHPYWSVERIRSDRQVVPDLEMIQRENEE